MGYMLFDPLRGQKTENSFMELRQNIELLFTRTEFSQDDREIYGAFKTALRRGEIRSAEKDADGSWHANAWVKQGILLGFLNLANKVIGDGDFRIRVKRALRKYGDR